MEGLSMNNAEKIKEAIKDYTDSIPVEAMEFFMYGVQNINSTADQLMMKFFRTGIYWGIY